ncbi:hypothetical protein DFH08DRAFT_950901 [Mycena albidolilacea]|uniref:RlpA-like protein double-psi beta-barrel domain-containing protein n=1 Tax=Mycena albidolilacea TaxID=1033008 RepID=A0AAD7ANA5_9AGAR|nr:hypothetical protein DFH08DRAFT_950901 [Mycena albidolilacea]
MARIASSISMSDVHNGSHIGVTIGDLCPGCGIEDIDLSQGAFASLAPIGDGRIPVQWHFK